MTKVIDETPWESQPGQTASDRDERRWDRGAWLTLAAAIVIVLWPIATGIASFQYPGDGWVSYSTSSFGSSGEPYEMEQNLTSEASPLRPGDVVTALDGRPFTSNQLPPVPEGLQAGQVLIYTLNRGDETLDISVPVLNLTPAAFTVALADSWLNVITTAAFVGVALFAFLARPGSHGARYLLLAFIYLLAVNLDNVSYNLYRYSYPPLLTLLAEQISSGWTWLLLPSLALMMLVYPVRKWPMRRFPRLLPAVVYGTFFLMVAAGTILILVTRNPEAGRNLSGLANGVSGVFCAVTILICLVHNFLTVRDPVARAQLRWLALGLGLGLAVPLLGALPFVFIFPESPLRDPVVNASGYTILLAPICLAIGILRYRLFDIDIIIRRTTSYAVITAFLALIYFGSIIVFQNLFGRVTGQNSNAAIVLSTLLIAALFGSVRRRVQDVIDRRFNRSRYDAEKTLARFATTVRDEPDLEKLTAELLNVIQETMQPASLSIWLRDTASDKRGAIGTEERV